MSTIEIEINGKMLTVRADQTIIQAADDAGIYIPRFCYHKHLSIAANCRMCLVEVEKSPKTLPACATPVMPNMKVFTKSPKAIEAQRAVMEFLLINHPLDCPICDQGGECELQDLSMGYGSYKSEYTECKRSVANEDLGALISTEMTRCISCTRCVRFGDEIAGLPEIGVIGRGETQEISTYIQHAIHSEVSGNIIDLCPVGALTSKPYRFTARAWELDQKPSISPHDCWGSNLNVHTLYGTVKRVVSRDNMAINETWISDRDRFSYDSLYHPDRLQQPMIRINDKLEVVTWEKALQHAAAGLQQAIAQFGSDQLGSLASQSSTVEEFYLLQKLTRALGSPNIDHRLRQIDTRAQAFVPSYPKLNGTIEDLENCDAVLLIGSNLPKEQPLAATRLRKAAKKGAVICAVNPVDYRFNFVVAAKKIVAPHLMANALAAIANQFKQAFNDVTADKEAEAIAQQLKGKQKVCIVIGALAIHSAQSSHIRHLVCTLMEHLNAMPVVMTDGANGVGAWLAGAVPHRLPGAVDASTAGLSAYEMLKQPRKAYLLLNVEPDLDCANASQSVAAINSAAFVVALSVFRNPILEAKADVILPVAPFTETSGTFVNLAGEWQSFKGAAKAYGESRPAWKVLRVLGNFLNLSGFDYESSEQIKHVVHESANKIVPSTNVMTRENNLSLKTSAQLSRIGEIPIYAIDGLTRRSEPLQQTQAVMEGDVANARIHPDTAAKFNIADGARVRARQGTSSAELTVQYDERIARDAIWIAGGIEATSTLGDLFGEVEIKPT